MTDLDLSQLTPTEQTAVWWVMRSINASGPTNADSLVASMVDELDAKDAAARNVLRWMTRARWLTFRPYERTFRYSIGPVWE